MKYQLILKVANPERALGELEIEASNDLDHLFRLASQFNNNTLKFDNTRLCIQYEFIMFCTNYFNSSELLYTMTVRG